MATKTKEIHCLLAPVVNSALLLPNSTVMEVVEFTQPQPPKSGPEWLLGEIDWQGWQIPVVDYAGLVQIDESNQPNGSHILVVKTLLESSRMPYIGVLANGVPKLVKVEDEKLVENPDKSRVLGIFSHVLFEEKPAIVPDLDRLTQLVVHAAYGALPIMKV